MSEVQSVPPRCWVNSIRFPQCRIWIEADSNTNVIWKENGGVMIQGPVTTVYMEQHDWSLPEMDAPKQKEAPVATKWAPGEVVHPFARMHEPRDLGVNQWSEL